MIVVVVVVVVVVVMVVMAVVVGHQGVAAHAAAVACSDVLRHAVRVLRRAWHETTALPVQGAGRILANSNNGNDNYYNERGRCEQAPAPASSQAK